VINWIIVLALMYVSHHFLTMLMLVNERQQTDQQ